MFKALAVGIIALGCVGSGMAVSPTLADDRGAVVHPFFTPSRLFSGSGVRPVSSELPSAAPSQPTRVLTDEGVEGYPAEGGSADGGCADGRCEGHRRHRGHGDDYDRPDGRWQQYPPRPCWVNDQYEPEWYIAPMFGVSDQRKQTMNWENQSVRIDPQGGGQGGVAFGWASGPTWCGRRRVEVELAGHSHDVDTLEIENVMFSTDGELSSVSAMVNLLWDFKHPDRDWYPYVGVGAGAARVEFETDFHPLAMPGDDNNSDGVFAYQAMAGLTYRARPWLELFGDVRYYATSSADLTTITPGFTTPAGLIIPAGERKLSVDYRSFGAMFGCRILLGKRRCVDDVPSYDGRRTSGSDGWKFRRF